MNSCKRGAVVMLTPVLFVACLSSVRAATYNVREFGAIGDGETLDTAAINASIAAAADAGGGTVLFPAGRYLSGSIHLRSNIGLHLEHGCVLEATPDPAQYDPPEPNVWGDEFAYQDFGHSHWHNSLIWGEGLENISITGFGLKSSFGLGYARVTENVTITNCQVSGYDTGSLLDGTYTRTDVNRAAGHEATGRIKFGTESNGGFRNITISNCVFDYCRGLALETVDGGVLEDVAITNITMRDVDNAPFFLRLGARMRGPKGVPIGKLRRITIDNVVAFSVKPEYSAIISGIPGHMIEDVSISNVRIYAAGGGTAEQAQQEPAEQIDAYPEPNRFKPLPAHGFYIRHVRGLKLRNIQIRTLTDDQRPAFFLRDVADVVIDGLDIRPTADVPSFVLKDVRDFSLTRAKNVADTVIGSAADREL